MATRVGATPRPRRRHIGGSRSFRIAATALAGGAALCAIARIASDRWLHDRAPPNLPRAKGLNGIIHAREAALHKHNSAILARDEIGVILLIPGPLQDLYWTSGGARKDLLSLEDIKKLATTLGVTDVAIGPDTVLFDACLLSPDEGSRLRIRERNYQMMLRSQPMPPPEVTFDRKLVPITARDLMHPAPQKPLTQRDAVLACMVRTCHRLPPGDLSRMVGHAVRHVDHYDPVTYGKNKEIGFGTLPAARPSPSESPAPPKA
jgi:hypothetical protein